MTYALALDNPPLLVVCDTNIIEIHTHFTNAPSEVHTIALEEISEPANLDKLRWLFTDPDKFHPKRTIAQITEEAAGKFADLAQSLNTRGHAPQTVAHFLNQCLFCLFAEDAELLPGKLFERLLDKSQTDPAKLSTRFEELFNAMRKGGDFALEDIHWFNGGLFENIEVLPLDTTEIKMLHAASKLDWSGIEPSIFGTLFERGLDPKKRAQLGAHYTDQQSIMRIINPVIVEPLAAEWQAAKAIIAERIALYEKGGKGSKTALQEAQAAFITYLEKLKNFRVLDPACGSGNFLYLALRVLKDLEHKANLEAEQLGLHRQVSIEVSPANVLGIELNPYAAELARVTVWIGEIQWMLKNGYPIRKNPILQPLDHIENRDALLKNDGTEAQWPAVDVIIGNPPFLGGTKKRGELGDDYFEVLAEVYGGRVSPGADLVCYWFQKAQEQIENEYCYRAGLVATNSIRQQANRKVLDRIVMNGRIFEAWSDEPWVNDGAAVRVSLVCFGAAAPSELEITLDGRSVTEIHANLRSGDDLTAAVQLPENENASFFGLALAGSFTIEQDQALAWLMSPNPNGRPNSDVVRPLWNGQDLTGRWEGRWVVDFGPAMSEDDAMLYEAPYQHVLLSVKPVRILNNRKSRAEKWWRHGEARPAMRKALCGLGRYISTSEKSKHRFFVWMDERVAPDNRLVVIARNDDAIFGTLSSRIHICWALAVGSTLEDRPAYATTTCFESFPFPAGLTPNLAPADYSNPASTEIAAAAHTLDKLRDNWLNPSEWTDWVRTAEEEKAGYPMRPVAKSGHETDLKKRTLTNLYNASPAWLVNAHKTLDAFVAKAYGWNDYTPELADEEILRRLLALNMNRSAN
jgi:type II restriction/modification system DNA methylase subunit YeeA